MSAILGIDLGAKMGWALLRTEDGARLGSGTYNKVPGGEGWHRMAQWLGALMNNQPIDAVAYENVRRHEGVMAAHAYGGCQAIVEMAWARTPPLGSKRLLPIEVAAIKRTATDKGRASKSEMQAAAAARWGREFASDEADALWIAETARRTLL